MPFTSYTPPCPQLPVKYTFQLAPQTQWLVGTSTNFGDDTDRDPDYLFEQAKNPTLATPQNGGLLINTPGFVTGSLAVTVTSRDFGGAGQLRASATFQDSGLTFDADIVDREQAGSPQVLPPSGDCGTAFQQRPFASLPVDQGCNSIADSWEAVYGNLPATSDFDRSPDRNSTVGDGLTVMEEYRGFHFINRNSGQAVVKWESTDPLNKLDLFFWDYDRLFAGDLDFFKSQFPFIELREVDTRMVRLLPDGTVSKINRNSLSTSKAFSLFLKNESLGAACRPGGQGGVLGWAPDEPKAYGPDGRKIRLDQTNLNVCARYYGFPQSDWRQILIAHEIGHNLGLEHPNEQRAFSSVSSVTDVSILQSLPLNKYTYSPQGLGQLYTWLTNYYYGGSLVRDSAVHPD